MKVDIAIARFPFKGVEHPDVTDFLMQTHGKTLKDPRVGKVFVAKFDDTPITMTRNQAVEFAKAKQVDYLLMVDSDMSPDLKLPGAKPFWDTAFEFALAHRPCVIGAPYVGPPPINNVYVFRWGNKINDSPNPDFSLDQYTRGEAETMAGIQECAALPTGLILIDMLAFPFLNKPYFYYEWKDNSESEKASTEDVAFTRDLSLAGVPMFCNWDAWAGHWKAYRCDKPKSVTIEHLRAKFSNQVVDRLLAERVDVATKGDEQAASDSSYDGPANVLPI